MVHEQHEQHEHNERVLFAKEVFAIQGAIFDVNGQMGAGFLEAVYQECLAHEFSAQDIPFQAVFPSRSATKGNRCDKPIDFICFDRIIVELKALATLTSEHRAQVLNYLRVNGYKLGLLVNFGCAPKARIERLAY